MQTLSVKDTSKIALGALVLGVLFNYLFYGKQVGVSFVVYVLLLLAFLAIVFFIFKAKLSKAVLWYAVPAVFFAVMAAVLDNMFLLFWNVVLTLVLLLLMARHVIGQSVKKYLFIDYIKTVVILPFKMIGSSFRSLGRMLSVGKGVKSSQKSSQITKGILITLPIVLLFLALLSSADLVFGRLVSSIFHFNFSLDPALVAQIWIALVLSLFWLGVYSYVLENADVDHAAPQPPQKAVSYRFGQIESGILFGTLNVLFFAFVIIQIKYLFAGHGAITKLGYTYAEYAHKGFGELIAVAVLTFGLIFLAERYLERAEAGHSSLFKFLSASLIVLVLVIMASAFMRLSIYEQAYSFTLLRVLVQAFIVWLAAVFLWLGYKIFFGAEHRTFIFGIFLFVLAFFFALNLLSPDAYIAKKNIAQFASTGQLDTVYIYRLSADAMPGLIPLLSMTGVKDKYGRDLPHIAAVVLEEYYQKRDSEIPYPWQSYNFSRQRARSAIEANMDLIIDLADHKPQ